MANPPSTFDKWRDYFRSINTDIFNIIEHAIMVAAKDYPYDFKLKRDRITELLFACKMNKCVGCDNIELAVPNQDDDVVGSKDTKVRACIKKPGSGGAGGEGDDDDDDREELLQMAENHLSACSYGDAEALTDEIEEESQSFAEVLRIKGVIDKSEQVPNEVLFDSLRRLQHMRLSVETLRATEIGKSVNGLRKHSSKDIQKLSRTLIESWKVMVDDWVRTTSAIAEAESRSVQKTPVGEEEEGLPSPPLDEAAFFATPNSMELSQFFDGMDDDDLRNFQNGGEFDTKNQECGLKLPVQEKPTIMKTETKQEPKRNQEKKQTPLFKPKANDENKAVQKSHNRGCLKKPIPPQREKLNVNDGASVQNKLEAAKRKLHERYQEAERAKKQRTVQVVELGDLPKQTQRSHQNSRHCPRGRR